jgi:hypothetical protein
VHKVLLALFILSLTAMAADDSSQKSNEASQVKHAAESTVQKAPVPSGTPIKAGADSAVLGYTKEFSPVTYKPEDCLQKNNFTSCKMLGLKKKSENKFTEALLFAKKACELNGEGCVGLYDLGNSVGPDSVTGLKKFLEDQCVKSAEACNEVSSIYESQKDYPNAIDYARKYYLKYQKGNFTKFSYLYGDKNEAFAASLSECNKNPADCVQYVRTMRDHPQLAKLVSQAELDCNQHPAGNSCLDTGLYFNKKANYKKSSQLWDLACKAEIAEACVFLMGSRGADAADQVSAFSKFCSIHQTMPMSLLNLKKMNCQNPSAKEIPSQLKVFSEYELTKAEKNIK